MADLTLNLNGLPPHLARRVIQTIRHEDAAAYALGVIEQRRLKQFYDNAAVAGMNTDLGKQTMCLSRGQWLMAMKHFGQTCFADPEFAPWLTKRNEEFRVKDVGTRIQSGFTGLGFTRPGATTSQSKAKAGDIVAASKYSTARNQA